MPAKGREWPITILFGLEAMRDPFRQAEAGQFLGNFEFDGDRLLSREVVVSSRAD